ncbi:MAG: adenylosuccinate lyase, partial [Vicinamibacterales bacterium]
PSARWLHFGLTSSDVIDTAQALQMREACDLILTLLDGLMQAARARAEEHRRTPMIGRTHGVHAEPMTFGLKVALWHAELQRDEARIRRAREVIAVGQISGAVGTFGHLPPAIEEDVCRSLGLAPDPVSSQVIQRDRHAELLSMLAITASTLEKIALEIRGLQKTEIGEVEEPFAKGQKGSSAMPHKRNPIGCEQIVGLARLLRANAHAALENNALWHERDISHSSVERVILPDTFIALDHMLRRMTRIVSGMVVYPERMLENLQRSRGVVFSGTVLLELARRGVSREQAYEWVQRNAMRAFHEQRDFKGLLLADADVTGVLPPAEIEKAFDLGEQLRHVDYIFERVFQSESWGPAPAGPGVRADMRARVFVTLKQSVFDPQGKTVTDALHSLGYAAVRDVRQGKYFELDIDAGSEDEARKLASDAAEKLLSNPVIESYRIEI